MPAPLQSLALSPPPLPSPAAPLLSWFGGRLGEGFKLCWGQSVAVQGSVGMGRSFAVLEFWGFAGPAHPADAGTRMRATRARGADGGDAAAAGGGQSGRGEGQSGGREGQSRAGGEGEEGRGGEGQARQGDDFLCCCCWLPLAAAGCCFYCLLLAACSCSSCCCCFCMLLNAA